MSKSIVTDDSDDETVTPSKVVAQSDPKGDDFKKQAEKTLKKNSFFNKLFGNDNKYQDAIDLYERAAAQYKMSKNWEKAGDIYMICATIYIDKLKESSDGATMYEHAAKAYKYVNTDKTIKSYTLATEILMENNKFSISARLYKEIGQLFEKDHNIPNAIKAFQKSADCYEADNSSNNANGMLIKVADLEAESCNYLKAKIIYEKVSNNALENSALKWQVNSYMFKSLLCIFATDPKIVLESVEKYTNINPMFDNSREKKLIEDLSNDYTDGDVEKFTSHVYFFDEIQKLDSLQTKILLEIKQHLERGDLDDENLVAV